jgi:hypothetical protein
VAQRVVSVMSRRPMMWMAPIARFLRTNGADVDTAVAAAGIETTDLLALDPPGLRAWT